jgi:hypothetical protein
LVVQVEAEPGVPDAARQALRALNGQFHAVREAAAELEAVVVAHAPQDETARRLATIPGIGPITASLIAATVTDAGAFRRARDFAAPRRSPDLRLFEDGSSASWRTMAGPRAAPALDGRQGAPGPHHHRTIRSDPPAGCQQS